MSAGQRATIAAELRAAGCVFAEAEADVLLATTAHPPALAAMVARRAAGAPLEHVVGWATFCGIRVTVAPGVFVPRARTELLVREAARAAAKPDRAGARPGRAAANPGRAAANPGRAGGGTRPAADNAGAAPVVVDLCCGSGAVGAAVAHLVPGIVLHAADLDPAAVRCARANLGASARVHEGDLYAALPPELRGRVDVLVANVPYVPSGELALMPAEARLHEPRVALDGGTDGLAVLARVAAGAGAWLAPGGTVLMETSRDQRPAALDTLAGHGLTTASAYDDDLDATVVIGRRPAR